VHDFPLLRFSRNLTLSLGRTAAAVDVTSPAVLAAPFVLFMSLQCDWKSSVQSLEAPGPCKCEHQMNNTNLVPCSTLNCTVVLPQRHSVTVDVL